MATPTHSVVVAGLKRLANRYLLHFYGRQWLPHETLTDNTLQWVAVERIPGFTFSSVIMLLVHDDEVEIECGHNGLGYEGVHIYYEDVDFRRNLARALTWASSCPLRGCTTRRGHLYAIDPQVLAATELPDGWEQVLEV